MLVILDQIVDESDEVLVTALQMERANEVIHRFLSRLRVIVTHRFHLNGLRKAVQFASALLDDTFVLEDHLPAIMEGHDRSQHRL